MTQTRRQRLHANLKNLMTSKHAISFRFGLLRLLLASSLTVVLIEVISGSKAGFGRDTYWVIGTAVLSSLVLIHHLATSFGPKLRLSRVLDLIFVVLETAATTSQIVVLIIKGLFKHTAESHLIKPARLGAWCIFLASLSLLLAIRLVDFGIASVDHTLKQCLRERYNYTWPIQINNARLSSASEKRSIHARSLALRVLLGNWKEHFFGEASWIVYSRGILSIAILLVVLSYAWLVLVVQPSRGIGARLVREYRSDSFPPGLILNEAPVFQIIVRYKGSRSQLGSPGFSTAQVFLQDFHDPFFLEVKERDDSKSITLTFTCMEPVCSTDPRVPWRRRMDILVTVCFDGMANWQQQNNADFSLGSADIFVGLTSDIKDITTKSLSVTLTPGFNLVGTLTKTIRRTFKSSAWGSFFQDYRTFLIADITRVRQDAWPPGPYTDSLFRGTNFSTIKMTFEDPTAEWRIIEDYRDESVFSGLASIGGLWTFLAGIFAAIYGTSIMKVLFAFKPMSVFGYAHGLQKSSLREAYLAEYPRVQEDLQARPQDRGLLALIHDHILDIDFLTPPKDEIGAQTRTTEKSNTPPCQG